MGNFFSIITWRLDHYTLYFIRLAQATVDTNSIPSSRDVKTFIDGNILPKEVFPIKETLTLSFTASDEDEGNLSTDLIKRLGSFLLVAGKNFAINEYPFFYKSIPVGIRDGMKLLGRILPQIEVVWEEFESDESLQNISFFGLGQQYLSTIKSTLREEIKNTGAVFEIDLSFLSKYKTRVPFEKYGCIAYFKINKEPAAIFWSHGQKFVFPNDLEWSHVKYVFRSSLMTAITLKDHLVHNHFILANTMLFATRESFNVNHPIRRLLKPHVFQTATVILLC
jgi:hypothetical protein